MLSVARKPTADEVKKTLLVTSVAMFAIGALGFLIVLLKLVILR